METYLYNLSSEITKLIPRVNEGYISASALQGRPSPLFKTTHLNAGTFFIYYNAASHNLQ